MSATPSTAYTHRSDPDGDDDDDDDEDEDDGDDDGDDYDHHDEHDVDDEDDDTRVYIQHNNKYHRMSSQRKRIFTVRSHKLWNMGRASQEGQGRCKIWDENVPTTLTFG